jgi:hypothetical protein
MFIPDPGSGVFHTGSKIRIRNTELKKYLKRLNDQANIAWFTSTRDMKAGITAE